MTAAARNLRGVTPGRTAAEKNRTENHCIKIWYVCFGYIYFFNNFASRIKSGTSIMYLPEDDKNKTD